MWRASLLQNAIHFSGGEKRIRKYSYQDISEINIAYGWIWAKVEIESTNGSLKIDGLRNKAADILRESLIPRIATSLLQAVEPHLPAITLLTNSINALLSRPIYIAREDKDSWSASLSAELDKPYHKVLESLQNPFFPVLNLEGNYKSDVAKLLNVLSGDSSIIADRNKKFVDEEQRLHKVFFDSVESSPLTEEQRIAAIVMEDRNLLVAAAGSGKTSSLVGKVGYALLRGYAKPEQILVLAFNNHAAQEVEARINARLKDLLGQQTIKVQTFHSLGMDIIREIENCKPTIAEFSSDSKIASMMMSDLIQSLMSIDLSFSSAWTSFLSMYLRAAKDPASFKKIEEWEQYVRETGDYVNKRNGYQTLNGELVKSQGELAIANWLYIHGVDYIYERAYEFKTADRHNRQYYPDFYFPDIDCYLEHYALDSQGNPPPAFGKKYKESMEWKRALHKEKGTDIFETYFSEFINGQLFPKLEDELGKRGIKFSFRSEQEMLKRINQHQKQQTNDFSKLLLTFIKHARLNQIPNTTLEAAAKAHLQPSRAIAFIQLFTKILAQYQLNLQRLGCIDFEDMILKASRYANSGSYNYPYRMILVDEFQDISKDKVDLLIGLLKHQPECKLFAVGDDWQSIYRFAGADISLFSNFPENFGTTSINYLTQTFRSNQGIADVAATFVQKNPAQLSKKVLSSKATRDKVITVKKYHYANDLQNHIYDSLMEIVALINDETSKRLIDSTATNIELPIVFLLGRYRHLRPLAFQQWQKTFAKTFTLEFKTIHGSKGLDADYVVLLGLEAGKLGFPSLIADDPLLELVMPSPEQFSNSEERRLFYVALTRARHGVFLLAHKSNPSAFIRELESYRDLASAFQYPEATGFDEDGQPLAPCPECGRGHLKQKKGKFGKFIGCSDYPTCRYTTKIPA